MAYNQGITLKRGCAMTKELIDQILRDIGLESIDHDSETEDPDNQGHPAWSYPE
jgi:ribosomal protein L30/L7E